MPEVNQAFFEARAAEARRRMLAYVLHAPAIDIPLRGGGTAIFPVVTLRWRHMFELLRSGNALASGGLRPLLGDVFEFLWRLHPYYRSPAGNWPNLTSYDRRPGWLRTRLSHWLVRRAVARIDLAAAESLLRARIREAFQDSPKNNDNQAPSALAPDLSMFDYASHFFAAAGWTREQILEEHVAWTFQVMRADDIMNGREDRHAADSNKLLRLEPASTSEVSP